MDSRNSKFTGMTDPRTDCLQRILGKFSVNNDRSLLEVPPKLLWACFFSSRREFVRVAVEKLYTLYGLFCTSRNAQRQHEIINFILVDREVKNRVFG